MKETYEKALIEVELFDASDVITESPANPMKQDDDNFGLQVL